VIDLLRVQGYEVEDFGTHSPEPVDFPDIARLVCEAVRSGKAERGVMVCGTGVGACIAANKIPGIRAALCHDTYSAHQCVEHDDVNVLCIGAWIVGIRVVEEILHAFLAAEFSTAEEFRRRVHKLAVLEQEVARR
jgi:ribose 5-phosphate isomerase B